MKEIYPVAYNIVYIAFVDAKYSGVYQKINYQSNALLDLGVAITPIIVSTSSVKNSTLSKNFIVLDKWVSKLSFFRKYEKLRKIREVLKQIGDCYQTVFYIRYTCPDPFVMLLLRKIARYCLIGEFQTIEHLEWKQHSSLMFLCERLFGGKARRMMRGVVGVTKEICDYELARSREPNKPYLVNGNGIEVSSVPIRTSPVFDERNLDLLCVAQVAKWHGLDRLIRGMAEYKGNVNVRLHVVGDGSEVPNLKKLVSDLKLENSVIFHGFKTGEELDELFDMCHIAVGSLGLHRIGVSEGSILKVREYCARGIPFIYGSEDSDFHKDFPYLLKVPGDETPIDVNAVLSFADRVLSDTEHSVKMRKYAEENLDWSIKMKKLVEFMGKVLESKETR